MTQEDRSIAAVEVNVPAEWQARCGVPADLYSLVIDFHRQSGNAATADVFSADPGESSSSSSIAQLPGCRRLK